ncbi:hypothetical protein [Pseudomonas sp. NFACC02]|uniref:hypothetical protein n=1 Tax=Pseudomonas sp. NFACC02 TaxID=1566250 RepID=UPI002113CBEA|nr:hypothetical protein [Pseudomonas sp. NFACC02]
MNVTTTSSAASSSVSTSNVKQKTVADTTQVPQDDDLATEHTRSADTVSFSKRLLTTAIQSPITHLIFHHDRE